MVFDRNCVPRIGFYLMLERLVLSKQETHSLVHQLYNINFYLKCIQSAAGGFSSSAFLFYSSYNLFFLSSAAFHLSSACLKALNFTLFVMLILFIFSVSSLSWLCQRDKIRSWLWMGFLVSNHFTRINNFFEIWEILCFDNLLKLFNQVLS